MQETMIQYIQTQGDIQAIAAFCVLAEQLAKQGNAERAEVYYKRALSVAERLHGSLHGEVGLILIQLARFYRSTGKASQARNVERRIDDILGLYLEDQCADGTTGLVRVIEDAQRSLQHFH